MSKQYDYICPCKGCKVRTVGCHSLCNLYKEWKSSGVEVKIEFKAPIIDFSKKLRRG